MLNVMTYNIHSAIGTDGQLNIERIADVITQSNANIIGLNEVDSRFHKRSSFEDQPLCLANELGMNVYFAPGIKLKSITGKLKGGFGNVLLTRFPIIHAETIPLVGWTNGEEPRCLLKAIIETTEGIIQVGVTHLGLNEQSRTKQVEKIQTSMNKELPTIIMGDFNAKPEESTYKMMTEHYGDIWIKGEKGDGYTFSTVTPKARIDYIFTSQQFRVCDARVIHEANGASDHFPLIAQLRQQSIKITFSRKS